jgi:hypothetical protein
MCYSMKFPGQCLPRSCSGLSVTHLADLRAAESDVGPHLVPPAGLDEPHAQYEFFAWLVPSRAGWHVFLISAIRTKL